jgi:LysM repeat protein
MFGSKGRKERKRLIALLLAGTMVLSGMGINPISVQAEETVVEQVQETEPVEAVIEEQGEEQGEETVSGGDVVMPEAEETEVLETEETGEASAPVVQNADGIYVFEAAIDAIISKLEKKAAIPEGKYGTDNYFTLSGTATRGNSNTYSAELGKAENGTLSFTVQGTASVTISITSTGSSNTSDFALLKSDGTKVIPDGETTGIITVYGTDPVKEVKYSKLEAGTYQMCSPKDGNNTGRGVRILSAKVVDVPVSVTKEYEFDAATDAIVSKLEKKAAVPEGKYGTDNYFTFSGTVTRGNSSTFSAEVGKTETGCMSFAVQRQASVTINITSTGSSNTSDFALLKSDGTKVIPDGETTGIITVYGTNPVKEVKYSKLEAGTYQICSPKDGNNTGRGVRILSAKVSDTTGGSRPARADWSTVEAPTLVSAKQITDKNDIEVKVTGLVGYDGADTLVITMKDEAGTVVKTQSVAKDGKDFTVAFTPENSGKYVFSVVATRDGEENKTAENTLDVDFALVLATPVISSATSKGNNSVEVIWGAVKEATGYIVTAATEGEKEVSVTAKADETTALLTGLIVGKTYTISVVAVRGENKTNPGTATVTVTAEAQRVWSKSTYGSSTDSKNNGVIGNANDGKVTVYSEGGKGKIVPGSTDGLTFYYTAIDPETENFTLTADIHVDSWTLSNGQEGFGMMAADAVGSNGDGTAFWNNTYQAIATKVEYYWDGEDVTTDSSANKISMKLGLGAISRLGVTADDVAAIKNGTITMPAGYVSETTTLETGAATKGPGTYNLVGNWNKKAEPTGNLENPLTDFRLQIQRNNTGYYLRYLDKDNKVIKEVRYYDLERTSLTQIDKDNIYVGFFASRNARITVSNIDLKTITPADDEKAEEREIEYVYPINTIESPAFSNSADYNLVYYGNADGTLVVKDQNGKEVLNKEFKALAKETVALKLNNGKNAFTINFIPDKEYKPGEFKLMTSYDPVTINHTVEYKTVENNNIYVSPNGKSNAAGTKDAPMDIYTAVKIAAPGQKILIKEGTYNLSSTVKVERGINGTADAMIYMIADPEAGSRPVFDFGGKCAGMILAGDYWYFQGFDVTGSADAQKGIQVSGNHNILDRIKAYKNGNTGIQISRYLGTDQFNQWPAHNTILNCSSYLNADKGYEDADGFAAKLTVGQGNVFDGCIAAYNADDGWDLFAKVQSGSIGVVTIQNCVAFKNGYILDENGREINAGNGNGFKMGGDSMPGAHVLKNSVAFANKAKGIDSNSCPDIKVYSSTTFDNESYNVAFYTNTAVNTAFAADGILSYKVSNKVAEQFKLLGTQNAADVKGATNYYFDGSKSVNNNGKEATASWFKSLDTASALKDGGITRNADGTINMNGFLELTDEVPEGVGARMSGRISGDITVIPDEPKQDDSKPENNNNNSNDNGSDSAGTSSAPETVNWNEVSSSVQDKVTEIAQNPAIATVNMNMVCTSEVQVPQKVLNTIKGTNVTVAFHSGNGVAMSISGQDLKNKDLSKIQNIDLTVDQASNNIPANVVAAKTSAPTRQLAIKDTGSFGVNVNIHVNVGKENAGKTANLYRYNAEKGRLEYCGSFTVTSNGQSMFALKRGGNYLVTVTERRPSESVWFAEGNYIVKAGDTLSKIAQRNHMTLAELLRRNAQITNRNVIKVGQRLNLN